MTEPIKVFFSYSRRDDDLRKELGKHLRAVQRQFNLELWCDREIDAGAEWEQEISAQLQAADIILLLVSPDFMNSDFCFDVELKQALARHDAGEACVIPVIVRPVMWKYAPFAKLQGFPENAKPVTEWSNRDSAWLSAVEGIAGAVERLIEQREHAIAAQKAAERARQEAIERQRSEAERQHQKNEQEQLEQERRQRAAEEQERRAEAERLRQQQEEEQQRKQIEQAYQIILQRFEFQIAKVGPNNTITHEQGWAESFIEDLGNGIGLEMVAIPGGEFMMGAPESEPGHYGDEGPQHRVTVAPFLMGRYPVTQAQWRTVAAQPKIQIALKAAPSHFTGENLPVESVSWREAAEFCQRLAKLTHRLYDLPSEAQWEYACRAGTTTAFHFGATITSGLANYSRQEGTTTASTHYRVANAFGLSEMHGNVWEWCQDHGHENYNGAPTDGSAWLNDNDSRRVRRGGSWFLPPRYCRSAYRSRSDPDFRSYVIGFRVALSVPTLS